MIALDITPLQWAESAGAGIVAAVALAAAILYGLSKAFGAFRDLLTKLAEVKSELESVKKKASSAAASAQKIDQSLHTNNSGSHVRDDMDKWAKSHALLDKKLDTVLEKVDHIDAAQKSQADEARTDRSAADMIHRELFRQVDELRANQ